MVPRLVLHSLSCEWLDKQFLGHWLGRCGPHKCPARSPDLTPCDFLWGWAKEEVYCTKSQTLDQLEDRIRHVLTNIPPEFLLKLVKVIPQRILKLEDNVGANLEF